MRPIGLDIHRQFMTFALQRIILSIETSLAGDREGVNHAQPVWLMPNQMSSGAVTYIDKSTTTISQISTEMNTNISGFETVK